MKELQELLKDKISNYEFQPLFEDSAEKKQLEDFEFKPLSKNQVMDVQEHERVIKKERLQAEKGSFTIAPIVREHRGMNRQEELERQRLIQEEVEKQLLKIQDQAYKEGFEKGLKDGQEEVFNQTRSEVEEKVDRLNSMVEAVLNSQADLIQQQKLAVYRTIKNLTKWIVLRELSDDGEYIPRLLEKLINELQVKSNVLIQLDPKSFEEMPDVLEMVQQKIGKLPNARVEIDYDISGPGIIVESDNGIINGTLKEQFDSLSRLFETVGLHEEENHADLIEESPDINTGEDSPEDNPQEPQEAQQAQDHQEEPHNEVNNESSEESSDNTDDDDDKEPHGES